MTAFAQHFAFEFRTGIRNRSLLFINYLFPLMFFVMVGFFMPALNPMFLEVLVPAMAAFAILASALLGLPDPLVSAREAGIFRSYKINGVPIASIVSIPVLSTLLHLCVVGAIITAASPVLFDAPLPVNWLGYVAAFLLLAVCSVSLGALIGVVANNTRMSMMLGQLIFLPSMLVGGLMIPYEVMPEAVQRIALLMPTTYAMNLFRGGAMGYEPAFSLAASAIILAAVGVLAFALALFLFTWDRRNAGRRAHPALGLVALLPLVAGMILLG